MTVQEIKVDCGDDTIVGALHLPTGSGLPCVIISHGLYGSKDSPKLTAMAEAFAAQGVAALRYDHRGCGGSGGQIAHTTVASRLEDLRTMLEVATGHPLLGGSIGLLGSSMGGFISLFQALRDPRVRALSLWSTPAFIRHPERDAPPGTSLERRAFLADAPHYDVRRVTRSAARCLILHGGADDVVPPFHARILHQSATDPKRLEILPGADHKFSRPASRERAIELSLEWCSAHL